MAARASDAEIARLESGLGAALPEAVRHLLRAAGAGLYPGGHELFGPMRLMIHDIELVPDMLTMRSRLASPEGPDLVPLHRGEGVVHFVRVRGERAGEVIASPGGLTYADVWSFVAAVILRAASDEH
jgi:hypothetical protein